MRVDLRSRLIRAFLLQTALISVTAVLGTLAAAAVLEEVLIKRALIDEAGHFWSRYAQDSRFERPDTKNLRGYLLGPEVRDEVPASLAELGEGFHRLESRETFSVAHITEQQGHRLILSFDGERVGDLALYFGLVPLACALAVLYLGAWVAYRLTRHAVSPIVWLADQVAKLDPGSADAELFSADRIPGKHNHEVSALSEALRRLLTRIDQLVERERNFTRDASHELRSPLTVVRLAAGMLLSEQELPRAARNSVLRIQRASEDMEELVDAFLLLARESEQGMPGESVCLNDVVEEEISRVQPLVEKKPVKIDFDERDRLYVVTSQKVLGVLVGNLLRNACTYTERGVVRVIVGNGSLRIEDSGVGIPETDVPKLFEAHFRGAAGETNAAGHGVGLTIVKRFSDRFRWPLSIHSTVGHGTQVQVDFPDAQVGSNETGSPA